VHRLDVDQVDNILAPIAPGEEAPAGVKVRRARVRVVDGDGEEFEKAARGSVTGRRDDRGHDNRPVRPPCFYCRQRRGFGWHKVA
jgi:hypothetical protein